MKGVVLGPVAAGVLAAFLTGSPTAGVVTFFVGLVVMVVLLVGRLGVLFRRPR